MSTDERDSLESEPEVANTLQADQPSLAYRGSTLGILIAAILVVEVSKDIAFSTVLAEWRPAGWIIYDTMMACLPFLLAWLAPKAAGFDTQWLPNSRRHWAWFFAMVFLLIVARVFVAALAATLVGRPRPVLVTGPLTPPAIILAGISSVLLGPIAEEIFFRGYLLEQLRKLTRASIALLVQGVLFGLYHLYTWGFFNSFSLINAFNSVLFGIILGAWRIRFRSLLPLVLVHVAANAIVFVPHLKARYDQVVYRAHPHFTICKETTYITEPLRNDGFVDYVAALNQVSSQGVTPESNAAVLFWKAVGPGEIVPEYREKYFQMLGIPPLPEKGDYFIDLDALRAGRRFNYTWDQLTQAGTRPWSAKEFPVIAAWLAANEKPLAMLLDASKRPRRYDPLCWEEKSSVIGVPQPAHLQYRDVARALCAQAMLRLSEGKSAAAWDDLLACHRHARLLGQGPTVMELFSACSVEGTACFGDQGLVHHTHCSAAQIAKMLADLNRLPPMPSMAEKLDLAERYEYLDVVASCSREWPTCLRELARNPFPDLVPKGSDPDDSNLQSAVDSLIAYSGLARR